MNCSAATAASASESREPARGLLGATGLCSTGIETFSQLGIRPQLAMTAQKPAGRQARRIRTRGRSLPQWGLSMLDLILSDLTGPTSEHGQLHVSRVAWRFWG